MCHLSKNDFLFSSRCGSMQWTRKYNPRTLDDVVGNSHIVSLLQRYTYGEHGFPNMLFVGPTGSGKSACAKCLVLGYLGDKVKTHLLVIDGSINRGKGIVTDGAKARTSDYNVNVIVFAKQMKSRARQKVVLFYNFDNITSEAQVALRSVMEDYPTIRFLLISNSLDNVKEAIQSRAVIFNFQALIDSDIKIVLTKIIASESAICNDEAIELITSASNGDLKKAVNMTECFCRGNVLSMHERTSDAFYSLFDIPQKEILEKFVNQVLGLNRAGAFDTLRTLVDDSFFNLFDVAGQLFNVIIVQPDKEIVVRLLKPLVICMSKIESESSSLYMYDMLYNMFKSLQQDMTFLRG